MSGLTKDELRSALQAAGLSPLPPINTLKEELLDLYRQHVTPRFELSDDEEGEVEFAGKNSSSSSSRSSKKSPRKKTSSKNMSASEISSLSDDELFSQLKNVGVDVGPIVSSTRQFYERKLASVLIGPVESTSKDFSDTEPEDEGEEEEDDQPSAVVSPMPEKISTRSSTTSPNASIKSPTLGSSLGLRQRLLQDETDSSFMTEQDTSGVSPRRSIHSYKVTEVRRETVRRDKDGVETRDSLHTVDREEGGRDTEVVKPVRRSWMSLFAKLLLLLLVCLGAYLVVTGGQSGEPVDDPVAQVMQALQGEGEGPRENVRTEEAPIQGNLGDI